MAKSSQGESWWPDLKLIILLVGVVCFEISFIFIVLKEDHYADKKSPDVKSWNWGAIVGIPIGTGSLFCCVWTYWNFVVLRPPSHQKLADPKTLSYLDPQEMEKYLEMEMFRRTILMMWYLFFTASSGFIAQTHCLSCETPYRMLAIGTAATYGSRLFVAVYTTYKCYYRNNLTIKELTRYQESLDGNRLFRQAFPDIFDSFTDGTFLLNAALFCLTVTLALVASTWVANKNCYHECHKVYVNTKVLLLGISVMEIIFSASSCVERYWRRTSGVEIIEKVVKMREKRVHEYGY